MALSAQEIERLSHKHGTELSALNAIVKLLGNAAPDVDSIDEILTILQGNVNQEVLPGVIRTSSSGSLGVDCYTFAIANVGNSTGTILGVNLKKGETLNFGDSTMRSFYPSGSFTWNATGTEFLIIYSY